MKSYYAVQARLIERRHGVIVLDETRLDTVSELGDAVREARRHASDGFTVWIYLVENTGGGPLRYSRVETIKPG